MTKAFSVERRIEIFKAIREKSLLAKDIANKYDISISTSKDWKLKASMPLVPIYNKGRQSRTAPELLALIKSKLDASADNDQAIKLDIISWTKER